MDYHGYASKYKGHEGMYINVCTIKLKEVIYKTINMLNVK